MKKIILSILVCFSFFSCDLEEKITEPPEDQDIGIAVVTTPDPTPVIPPSPIPIPTPILTPVVPDPAADYALLDVSFTGWMFGCTPSAVGAVLGYYDRVGYKGYRFDNIIPGGEAEASLVGSRDFRLAGFAISSDGTGVYTRLASDPPVLADGEFIETYNGKDVVFETIVTGSDNDIYNRETLLGRFIVSREYLEDTWNGYELYVRSVETNLANRAAVSGRTELSEKNCLAAYLGTRNGSTGSFSNWMIDYDYLDISDIDNPTSLSGDLSNYDWLTYQWNTINQLDEYISSQVFDQLWPGQGSPYKSVFDHLQRQGYADESMLNFEDDTIVFHRTDTYLDKNPSSYLPESEREEYENAEVFDFNDYAFEIDNERPVLLLVEGHVIVGCGYEIIDGKNYAIVQDSNAVTDISEKYRYSFEWGVDQTIRYGLPYVAVTIKLDITKADDYVE